MRSARALLASLGAGTSLVLAGTLAMAALSTVVAFSGLPGVRDVSRESPAAILAAAQPVAEAVADADSPVTLVAPKTLVRRARATPAQRARRRSGANGVGNAAAQVAGTSGGDKSAAKGGANGSPGVTATPVPAGAAPPADEIADADLPTATVPSAGGAVKDTGKAVADGVKTAVDGVAKAVAPVAPAVAPPVRQTGTVAADTVQGVTDTAGDAVQGLTGGG